MELARAPSIAAGGLVLQPQDAYGLEKLASEELAKHYGTDFAMETRIARFHNIYGPYGTWKGATPHARARGVKERGRLSY
jgi:nucleoside-diphosphate-sugar epimerase